MTEIDRLKFIAECPGVKEVLCPRCLGDKLRENMPLGSRVIQALFCEGCGHKFWIRRSLPINKLNKL